MAPGQQEPATQSAAAAGVSSDGSPSAVVRRAPFADNPHVGARGQRTQQRILDAALRVFGEVGYHPCNIAKITKRAGCSRASFYQYFSSKEDVFRQLAGQVARQLTASAEALDQVTADVEGWLTARTWVARHADIYRRYEPVYKASRAALESDEAIQTGSARSSERTIAMIRSKLATTDMPSRKLDPVILLLLECMTRAHESAGELIEVAPESYSWERMDDALTDVFHRTMFGLKANVNVHPQADKRPPSLKFGPLMEGVIQQDHQTPELTEAGKRTLDALMKAGRDVFVARGYHGTRVDDVVNAAGVSHGAFYRYFQSKDHLAQVLAGRAVRTVSTAFSDIPETLNSDTSPGRTTLRRWLRRYNATQATEEAMIRVWSDAALQDPSLQHESAAILDWGRRRMARFLQPRDFGDVDTEAVVMMSLLSAFGVRERPAATIDAAAYIIEHGLLGQ